MYRLRAVISVFPRRLPPKPAPPLARVTKRHFTRRPPLFPFERRAADYAKTVKIAAKLPKPRRQCLFRHELKGATIAAVAKTVVAGVPQFIEDRHLSNKTLN